MGKYAPVPLLEHSLIAKRIAFFISEFLGTFILLFLGCSGCVAGIHSTPIPHEQISFTFGFAILVAVQVCGHISGAHINPAVTVAAVIFGNTPIILAPLYFVAQIIGALAGYGAVMLVTPSHYFEHDSAVGPGICSPGVNKQLNVFQGLAVEFIATGILILVCCAVWDRKNTDKHDSLTIRFGLTVAVLAMALGPYSGTNMNPARSFAPALLNGDWKDHWVYWVGPLGAAAVLSTVYKFTFQTPPPKEHDAEEIPLR